MEKTTIETDIPVFYVTAKPFPDDVPDAYQRLHSKISNTSERRFFGISHPNEKGVIIYKAAAEELGLGEGAKYGCETFTIKKGEYVSIYIKDHMKDSTSIGDAFKKLLANPDIDHDNGYCLEIYKNYTDPDVNCLVPLK
jgi:predicted transcriptional regulator YdeE